jgi:hypothetical protein
VGSIKDFVLDDDLKLSCSANAGQDLGQGHSPSLLDLAITRGWLVLHESGTYVKFTGAQLFA